MNDKLKKTARIGYVAKGAVYAITGILTLLAAFNQGGQKAGKFKVVEYLDKQTFGNIILIILALGLICYAYWRFTQAISDPENIGSDKKGKVKRTAFFVSGCIYLGLAIYAVLRVINSSAGSGGSSGKKATILSNDWGLIVLGIVGGITIATGLYQFVRIYKADFVKKFELKSMTDEKRRKTIKNSAYFGMGSKGVLFIIIGFFLLKASITSNPADIKTTSDAFSFLEDSAYGAYLLGAVAAGLIGYAIYMFMMAKYRKFSA